MGASSRATSQTIRLTALEGSCMPRVTGTKASGKTTRHKESVSIRELTAVNTTATGSLISNTERVRKFGPTAEYLKAITRRARNVASAYSSGPTAARSTASLRQITSKALAGTIGSPVVSMRAVGRQAVCMAKAYSAGPTVVDSSAILSKTRSKATACFWLRTAVGTRASGAVACNMVLVSRPTRTVSRGMAGGAVATISPGSRLKSSARRAARL